MAIIDPAFIDPDAPPRVRGQFIVQKWRDKYIMRRWPRRGGPLDKRIREWQRAQFSIAAQMCANPYPIDLWTAIEVVKGTMMVPRDFLMMCCYARGYVVVGPDGIEWTVADHGPPPITEMEIITMQQANPLGWPGPALSWYTTASIGANFMRLKPVIVTPDMIINGVQIPAITASATAHMTPVLYQHVSGAPYTLLTSGPTVIGASAGVNNLPFSAPYTPTTSMLAWLGWIHTTANITMPNLSAAAHAFKATSSDTPQNPVTGVTNGNTQAAFWGY